MKKKCNILLFLLFTAQITLLAQNVTVTGTVISTEDQQPLPGASVLIKGTTIGTITDYQGKYTITVPSETKILVVSFLGFINEEVAIGGQTTINFKLVPDVAKLGEVVVTALGIKRQAREIGYATQEISHEKLLQAKPTNLTNALSGKIAGLQISTVNNGINADTRVVLRGNRSLLGNNQALFVIDGVPVPSSYISSINPDDYEITVLKGANAAALYGSEAANGVIILSSIETNSVLPIISVSHTTQLENVSFLPKFQTKFGSGSGVDDYGSPVFVPYENQSYGPKYDGSIVEIGHTLSDGTIQKVTYESRPNEKKNFFNTGITNQEDFSYSIGDDKNRFKLSARYVDVNGTVPKDESQWGTFRITGDRKTGNFRVGYNATYANVKTSIAGNNYGNVYWLVLNTPGYIPLTNYKNWQTDPYADPNGYFNDYYTNPYTAIDKSRNNSKTNALIGTLELEYVIAPWLKTLFRTNIEYTNYTYKNTKEGIHFSKYAASTSVGRYYSSKGDISGSVSDGSTLGQRWTNDFILTFDKEFGNFGVSVLAGATNRDSYNKSIDISASALEIDGLYNIKNRIGDPSLSEQNYHSRTAGVFGDITIGYKSFLFLHTSGRNDYTSVLKAGNNSFFYPGADISFVFTDAIPGLKNNVLNFGKLKGGISKVGTVNLDPYQLQNTFAVASNYPYGNTSAYSVSDTRNNPDLKPESTISKEIGIELGFLESRANIIIAIYQTNTKDQTLPAQISSASGYTSQYINTGETQNQGIEISTDIIPVKLSNGFTWEVELNYAAQKSEVLSVSDQADEVQIGGYTNGSGVWAIKGYSYPQLKVIDFNRDPQGHIIVDGTTGNPSVSNTLKIAGGTSPKNQLGISTTIKYKGFTFSALAEHRGGYVIWNQIGQNLTFTGVGYLSATNDRQRFVIPNSVIATTNGDVTTYIPNTNVLTQDGGVEFWTNVFNEAESPYVTSAAFWKLREVSFSYNLPLKVLPKFLKELRVGIVGRNLFTWLPKSNIYTDPEFNFTTGNAIGLTTNAQTPPTRIYGFTISIKF